VQLLAIDLIADALDVLDDDDVRQLLLTAMQRCKAIGDDEDSIKALAARSQTIT
jgi:hypothetical protein